MGILHWTFILPVLWPRASFRCRCLSKVQCRAIRLSIFSCRLHDVIPTSWCQQLGVIYKRQRRTDDSSPRRPSHENLENEMTAVPLKTHRRSSCILSLSSTEGRSPIFSPTQVTRTRPMTLTILVPTSWDLTGKLTWRVSQMQVQVQVQLFLLA